MLKQDAITPLYVQLMEELETSIRNGVYKPGDKIMTEAEMAKEYGVSLITVRKAVGSLMEKGLVVRKQGKGTFVTKPKYSRNMKKLQSFTEMCEQMGVKPGAQVLENRLIMADKKVADRLGIDPVVLREKNMVREGQCGLYFQTPPGRRRAGPGGEKLFPFEIRLPSGGGSE